jgi:predicted transcriptional regulator
MSENTSNIDAESPVAAVTAFDIETASPSAELETLARQMARNDVGALVIQSHDGEVAILTERDIMHAVAFDIDAWAVDVMTRDVIEVASTTTIADAAETMRTAGVRHLLVRRADGKLGITSIRDLLGPLLDTVG